MRTPAAAPSYDSAGERGFMGFHYVYILQRTAETERFYVGRAKDLRARLQQHNRGEVSHGSKHRLWRVNTAVAFTGMEKAIEFERYLQTPSGRAFARKRL